MSLSTETLKNLLDYTQNMGSREDVCTAIFSVLLEKNPELFAILFSKLDGVTDPFYDQFLKNGFELECGVGIDKEDSFSKTLNFKIDDEKVKPDIWLWTKFDDDEVGKENYEDFKSAWLEGRTTLRKKSKKGEDLQSKYVDSLKKLKHIFVESKLTAKLEKKQLKKYLRLAEVSNSRVHLIFPSKLRNSKIIDNSVRRLIEVEADKVNGGKVRVFYWDKLCDQIRIHKFSDENAEEAHILFELLEYFSLSNIPCPIEKFDQFKEKLVSELKINFEDAFKKRKKPTFELGSGAGWLSNEEVKKEFLKISSAEIKEVFKADNIHWLRLKDSKQLQAELWFALLKSGDSVFLSLQAWSQVDDFFLGFIGDILQLNKLHIDNKSSVRSRVESWIDSIKIENNLVELIKINPKISLD